MLSSSIAFLPLVAAACALLVAVLRLLRSRLTVADAAFVAGFVAISAEQVFAARSISSSTPALIVASESWRLVLQAVLPGLWMLAARTYARGAAKLSPLATVASIVVPTALTVWLRPLLVVEVTDFLDSGRRVLALSLFGYALQLWLLIGSVVVLLNLERTFRASIGMMRWRIKYTLLGLGLLFVVRLYTSSQALLFGGLDLQLEAVNAIALVLAMPLLVVGIYRDRLEQTDVYPSQTVLHSSATVLLAGIYLLFVGVFAKLVVWFGGGGAFAVKAFLALVAIVATAVVLQSDNARLKLRQFLSRHFHRPVFDYRKVWRTFTETSATKVDQAELSRSMVKLVAQTFEALSVSLWFLDDERHSLSLAASTAVGENSESVHAIPPELLDRAVLAAGAMLGAVNLDRSQSDWAAVLCSAHPRQFPHGGDRWMIPISGKGQPLGLLLVGDRVGGEPLGVQELDMLRCVADHIGSSVLNIRLSNRLLQSKELEAFQTMATFFVHDLKNAASTLNLMLRNLPVHFDDPEFRQDALRGMEKTVNHINGLIARLSSLRQEMKLNLRPTDLNDLITKAVKSLDAATRDLCRLELQPLPPVAIDPEQVGKVITNLLINGREALVAAGGAIVVSTSQTDNSVTLTVSDTGCGMSPEFLRNGLFRPFQTTKKTGLGIGMFQSKSIVEAHGGRISATSELGRGTVFRVQLPFAAVSETAPTTEAAPHARP